jgi:hypothetical protein
MKKTTSSNVPTSNTWQDLLSSQLEIAKSEGFKSIPEICQEANIQLPYKKAKYKLDLLVSQGIVSKRVAHHTAMYKIN